MTLKEFLNKIEEYYEAYYEGKEGFESNDDLVGILDLAFTFYESKTGKKHGK